MSKTGIGPAVPSYLERYMKKEDNGLPFYEQLYHAILRYLVDLSFNSTKKCLSNLFEVQAPGDEVKKGVQLDTVYFNVASKNGKKYEFKIGVYEPTPTFTSISQDWNGPKKMTEDGMKMFLSFQV